VDRAKLVRRVGCWETITIKKRSKASLFDVADLAREGQHLLKATPIVTFCM
jgi:hypothetical protein